MSVCQNKSCCSASGACVSISVCFGSYQSILDLLAVFLQFHFAEGSCPVVVCGKSYFLAVGYISCIDFCLYCLRTDSILVICIIPYNRCFYFCFCRYVSCCNCKSGCCISCNLYSIIRNFTYPNCINNFLTSFILSKSAPFLSPVAVCVNSNRIAGVFSICFQLQCYRCRADSILVVTICPFYSCCYVYCFYLVCIFQNKAFCSASGCCQIISVNLGCLKCVVDWFTIFVYCKFLEGCLPVCVCGKTYFFVCRYVICIKFSLYSLRTDSILVVLVIPVCRYSNINTLWCVAVCDCETCCCISGCCLSVLGTKTGLLYCVSNLLTNCTSFIDRKIIPCLGPVSICVCFYSNIFAGCFTICFQLQCYRCRANSILVLCIIPFNGCCYGCNCRFMSKCNCQSVCCTCVIFYFFCNFQRIVHCFADFTCCVYRHIFDCCSPVLFCCKSYCLVCCCATCVKNCVNRCRTNTILVVRVIPFRRYCEVFYCRCVGVLNCDSSCFFIFANCSCVSFRKSGFFYCVFDHFTGIVFRKVCPCLGPVSICICFYSYVITNVYCIFAFNF